MFDKMFEWIFGSFKTPGNIDKLYGVYNEQSGHTEWFLESKYDCDFCGAPGFECENTKNCRYYPFDN